MDKEFESYQFDKVYPSPVAEFFGPGGELSKHFPGWEFREGQLAMACEVEEALAENRKLIIEAGTGTGKTLAYLIPLILANKRAVISTGTKNLQDQLVKKDIPLLEKHLGLDLQVAIMKGRQNYLCLHKLSKSDRNPALLDLKETSDIVRISDWAESTQTGDRSELGWMASGNKLWPQIDARREACNGSECSLYRECFISRMHQKAREADLIIINHHLFFADLAMAQDDFGSFLPKYETVVFDEAHELESIASQLFGIHLSSFEFDELARSVTASAVRGKYGSLELNRELVSLRKLARAFFGKLGKTDHPISIANPGQLRTQHARPYEQLQVAITGLVARLKLVGDQDEEISPLTRRAIDLQRKLAVFVADEGVEPVEQLDDDPGNYVYWMESRRNSVSLHATPIDVSQILEDALFDQAVSIILTSATLAYNDSFDYVRSRLGLHSSNELQVEGCFDYPNQVLLYIPSEMPELNSPGYVGSAVEQIVQIVRHSKGRAFVLFTSHQQMKKVHQKVQKQLEYPCLLQGDGSNPALLEVFRATDNCVLFATASFWQGVDVPGEQLSCVIVEKLPFAVPSDPVVEARINQIRESGGNAFFEYQLPNAVLSLRQGFGRLIRGVADRGVLALLDVRVLKKSYGRYVLDSLPNYTMTHEIDDVEVFFRE